MSLLRSFQHALVFVLCCLTIPGAYSEPARFASGPRNVGRSGFLSDAVITDAAREYWAKYPRPLKQMWKGGPTTMIDPVRQAWSELRRDRSWRSSFRDATMADLLLLTYLVPHWQQRAFQERKNYVRKYLIDMQPPHEAGPILVKAVPIAILHIALEASSPRFAAMKREYQASEPGRRFERLRAKVYRDLSPLLVGINTKPPKRPLMSRVYSAIRRGFRRRRS